MSRQMKDSGIEWIGEIPKTWDVRRIKTLPDRSVENSFIDGDWIESPYIEDEGIRYLTTGNIGDGSYKYQGNGFISDETFDKLNCKFAYPGDLVISRLNAPYGRSCILPDEYDKYVLAVDNVILRTNENKRFICYLTQCDGYHRAVEDAAKGTTMQRISRTNLGNIALPIASTSEQEKIANYLDQQCAHIDTVIEKTKASIEEYKKLKQAVITQAVTKGIRGDRPMRFSGDDVIGDIPLEWICSPVKYLASYNDESLGENTDSEYEFDYVEIGSVLFGKGIIGTEHMKFVNAPSRARRIARKDDIILSTVRTYLKAVATVTAEKQIVSTGFVVIRPKAILPQYLQYAVLSDSFINKVEAYSTGISYPAINSTDVVRFKVTVPNENEQKEIVDYLDNKTLEIEKLIDGKEKVLLELEDYKKSLIYEYVTGKKEVPVS